MSYYYNTDTCTYNSHRYPTSTTGVPHESPISRRLPDYTGFPPAPGGTGYPQYQSLTVGQAGRTRQPPPWLPQINNGTEYPYQADGDHMNTVSQQSHMLSQQSEYTGLLSPSSEMEPSVVTFAPRSCK